MTTTTTTKFFLNPHPKILGIFSNKASIFKPKIQFLPRIFSTLTLDKVNYSYSYGYGYGPSLRKGKKPFLSQNQEISSVNDNNMIDKESFTRVFELVAIRVPSEDCFALESQLRGHLLNWPRIRNIARVPGDEMEEEFRDILPEKTLDRDGDGDFDALNRRVYGRSEGDGMTISPVLYRDKLVKTFGTHGFVKFRNLEKISRPKKKGKLVVEGEGGGGGGEKRVGKNDVYVVEEVRDREDEDDDMTGLLGEEFGNGKWRGSTRLLLLDEQFATKEVNELPEAIKALFNEGTKKRRICDLVMCRLTLFYNYWQMNEILEGLLPKGMIVPTAFEMVGHIAHLNLREEHLPFKKIIAQVVLDKNNPKIKTVANKIDSIQNEYRTMQLEVLAGNHSLVTTVIENGSRFHVDLAAVYWNSKLATERQRLVNSFTSSDVVCDVFSGVGPLAIAAAKKVKHVYANDLNPSAVEYLEKNSVFNKLEKKVTISNMDGRRFIESMLTSKKTSIITQVVMNLPKDAAEFLDVFRGVLVKRGKPIDTPMHMIHVYGFSKAQDPEFDFHQWIKTALLEFAVEVKIHKVRLVAPGKWMLCASFVLPESVAYAKKS